MVWWKVSRQWSSSSATATSTITFCPFVSSSLWWRLFMWGSFFKLISPWVHWQPPWEDRWPCRGLLKRGTSLHSFDQKCVRGGGEGALEVNIPTHYQPLNLRPDPKCYMSSCRLWEGKPELILMCVYMCIHDWSEGVFPVWDVSTSLLFSWRAVFLYRDFILGKAADCANDKKAKGCLRGEERKHKNLHLWSRKPGHLAWFLSLNAT